MKLLLDTCTFLWTIWDEPNLVPAVRTLLADPANEVWVSSISIWEAVQKHRMGKLEVNAPEGAWQHFVTQRQAHDLLPLSFDEADARHLSRLPLLHRDPFDRMLICQSIERGLTLVTPDREIQRYPIRTVWG
jgi:PIN domain nuclease of toxin-antitoxin system